MFRALATPDPTDVVITIEFDNKDNPTKKMSIISKTIQQIWKFFFECNKSIFFTFAGAFLAFLLIEYLHFVNLTIEFFGLT
jgi:hypothetical protein